MNFGVNLSRPVYHNSAPYVCPYIDIRGPQSTNMEVVGGSLLYFLYACAHYDITVTIDTGIAVTMDTGISYQ